MSQSNIMHLKHKNLDCFTECGVLSRSKTTDMRKTTCLNCIITHWFYNLLLKKSHKKTNRKGLGNHDFVTAIGTPVALRGNNLLIRNLIINNQFMLDHIWLHGADVDPSKIIMFRAQTYQYVNKWNQKTFGLASVEILKTY